MTPDQFDRILIEETAADHDRRAGYARRFPGDPAATEWADAHERLAARLRGSLVAAKALAELRGAMARIDALLGSAGHEPVRFIVEEIDDGRPIWNAEFLRALPGGGFATHQKRRGLVGGETLEALLLDLGARLAMAAPEVAGGQ